MIKDAELNEIISQIQAQYRDTNIKELLAGIVEIVEKYAFNCMNSLENDGLNLATARGDFLDLWAYILGISRYMPLDESQLEQRFFNFRNKNFLRLQFYYKQSALYGGIADVDLRILLLFLAQKMYNCGNIADTNTFLKSFFDEFGGVLAIRDTQDMSFYWVYFEKEPPTWLKFAMENYDILPRPAGVGVKFGTSERRIFGFETNDQDYNQNILGAFNKSNFKDLN